MAVHIEQKIKNLLRLVAQQGASDLHLTVGRYPTFRIDGKLYPQTQDEILTPEMTRGICNSILGEEGQKKLAEEGQADFSYSLEEKARFRVNAFFQQGRISVAFRLIPREIRTLSELMMPDILYDFTKMHQGLVLIVGPVGHGKSTTLAALINEINHNQEKHIITIEDPIEYVYDQDRCIINQREIYQDSKSFKLALKSVFREDANVVLIGEMRDLDTISTALTAAETGHLIFATLHTNDCPQTIDRIVDVFPAHQQNQVRSQLANVLLGVASQRLLPCVKGGRVPAVEIMIKNHAVENLIRENKSYQLDNVIETSSDQGMITLDKSLAVLVKSGMVAPESALAYAKDAKNFQTLLKY
ncbi:type IV pili twitching motility protein PilT [candidate division WOR-1 bacterium RIFOXYA12_FULL_43_27]|nr:MAG: type IV pili twitching motility protein PilT [candidate division WOR-1 bacterium RIFOXYA12_FULL_43_27]OGI36116.1 MAG: type IV pili twitching motility protein PilT [Candidatus Moranbacteria bacterium RIFOXYA2_FULL_43_15]